MSNYNYCLVLLVGKFEEDVFGKFIKMHIDLPRQCWLVDKEIEKDACKIFI